MLTGEGLLEPQSGKMVYQYFIKDHLGNNRILFNQDNLVRQQSSYYPFGMLVTPPTRSYYDYNRYLYNGKELQDDFELDWYDYGARFYDAEVGRWHVVDNKAERYFEISPYVFVANNTLRFIDPDGNDWLEVNGSSVNRYGGDVGNKQKLIKSYKATSGSINYQKAKYQNYRDAGPTPEGLYSINLAPSPDRKAVVATNGKIKKNSDGGIENMVDMPVDGMPNAVANSPRSRQFATGGPCFIYST